MDTNDFMNVVDDLAAATEPGRALDVLFRAARLAGYDESSLDSLMRFAVHCEPRPSLSVLGTIILNEDNRG
jgi:hypothetical protein